MRPPLPRVVTPSPIWPAPRQPVDLIMDSSGNPIKKAKDSERVTTKSGRKNTRTSRGATSTRLQPTQSGAAAVVRELFRVEDTLCLQIACSDEGAYEGSCANARLHLNLDDNIPKRIVERINRRLNLLPEESGRLEHHHRIMRDVYHADELRAAEFQRLTATPPNTLSWDLSSASSRYYLDAGHSISVRPPPLPETHVAGTPAAIQRDSLLPITFEALTAQEQLSRLIFHEFSAALEELDNVRCEVKSSMTPADGEGDAASTSGAGPHATL